jgi:hypothetical protein
MFVCVDAYHQVWIFFSLKKSVNIQSSFKTIEGRWFIKRLFVDVTYLLLIKNRNITKNNSFSLTFASNSLITNVQLFLTSFFIEDEWLYYFEMKQNQAENCFLLHFRSSRFVTRKNSKKCCINNIVHISIRKIRKWFEITFLHFLRRNFVCLKNESVRKSKKKNKHLCFQKILIDISSGIVCQSVCLSVRLFVSLFVCLFLRQSVC